MNTTMIKEDELMSFMKSLADAERLKIAGLLGVEALSAEQVAERLGMQRSEAQNHLDELTRAGLAHQEGSLYRLDSQALEKSTRQVNITVAVSETEDSLSVRNIASEARNHRTFALAPIENPPS